MSRLLYTSTITHSYHLEISSRCAGMVVEETDGFKVGPLDGYPAVSDDGGVWHVAILSERGSCDCLGYAIGIPFTAPTNPRVPNPPVDAAILRLCVKQAVEAANRHAAYRRSHCGRYERERPGKLPYAINDSPYNYSRSAGTLRERLRGRISGRLNSFYQDHSCIDIDVVIAPHGRALLAALIHPERRSQEPYTRGVGLLVQPEPDHRRVELPADGVDPSGPLREMLSREIMSLRINNALDALDAYGWGEPGDCVDISQWQDR